jgi:uncharacterized membrane protein
LCADFYIRGFKVKGKIHPVMHFLTFLFSALWHGVLLLLITYFLFLSQIYPGFFIHFFVIFMMTVVENYYYSFFPPLPSPNPKFGETEEAKAKRIEKEKTKGINSDRKRTVIEWIKLVLYIIYIQFMADFGATAFLVYIFFFYLLVFLFLFCLVSDSKECEDGV